MIIGICGKSGCGKSTLANQIIELTNHSAVHLDIDQIGHQVLLLSKVKKELVKAFGESIFINQEVDRKRLGNITFHSKKEMAKLTDITWNYMQIEIDRFLSLHQDKIVILDWQLLSITKYFPMCDIKILLDIPYEIRKERAMKRDHITEEAFNLREQASISFREEEFDYVFKTNNINEIKGMVKSLWQKFYMQVVLIQ